MEVVKSLIVRMRKADEAAMATARAELLAMAMGDDGALVREYIDSVRKGELLELQWELEEVLEEATPVVEDASAPSSEEVEEVEAPEAEVVEPEDPNRQLTAADLKIVYEDPRGLGLHKSKKGERWFATQVDPRSGQPRTFELHQQEVEQLKAQLAGSPYWILGS